MPRYLPSRKAITSCSFSQIWPSPSITRRAVAILPLLFCLASPDSDRDTAAGTHQDIEMRFPRQRNMGLHQIRRHLPIAAEQRLNHVDMLLVDLLQPLDRFPEWNARYLDQRFHTLQNIFHHPVAGRDDNQSVQPGANG